MNFKYESSRLLMTPSVGTNCWVPRIMLISDHYLSTSMLLSMSYRWEMAIYVVCWGYKGRALELKKLVEVRTRRWVLDPSHQGEHSTTIVRGTSTI